MAARQNRRADSCFANRNEFLNGTGMGAYGSVEPPLDRPRLIAIAPG